MTTNATWVQTKQSETDVAPFISDDQRIEVIELLLLRMICNRRQWADPGIHWGGGHRVPLLFCLVTSLPYRLKHVVKIVEWNENIDVRVIVRAFICF